MKLNNNIKEEVDMKQIMIRMSDKMLEQVDKLAKEETRSRSNMIKRLIEEALIVRHIYPNSD